MKTRRLLAAVMTFALLDSAPAAAAGKLLAINPRLKTPDLALQGYTKTPTFTTVSLPKDFLDKKYLFGAMVEASTDNYLTMGAGAGPLKVRWTVEGDRALMLVDKNDRLQSLGGAAEDALNRFPLKESAGTVELDLAHPEVASFSLLVDQTQYAGSRPGYIYDLVQEPGYLSWGEKFICQAQTPGDGPAQLTLAIKYYLLEVKPPAAFKAKVYPPQDQSRYGFFTADQRVRKENGTTRAQSLVTRWDLSKKIVYLLHPSIPEAFRPAFRESILAWNKVFQRTNGVEPIEVRDGDNRQLPGDIRAHVLYWVDEPTPFGNGAIGPSSADPDTGEIIDGDVIFYADSYRETIARLREIAEATAPKRAKKKAPEKLAAAAAEAVKNPRVNRGFKLMLGSSPAIAFDAVCSRPYDEAAKVASLARADISQMTDEQAMDRLIRETIPHEIGHTLGLRHNFKATADLAHLDEGHDSTSVMDYENDLQARLQPGPYDYAAIAYGYDGEAALHEGQEFFYATDEDQGLDPLANQWDSGDPLAFYTGRYKFFLKVRDGDFFSSMGAYMRSQLATLRGLRRLVNKDEERGPKAFQTLVKILLERGAEPPFNVLERYVAMRALTEPADTDAPLGEEQQSLLGQALAANVAPDGEDDFDVRVAMLDALRAMKNIHGYKGLEAAKKALGARPAGREQEIGLRLKQAMQSYFQN